MTAYGGVAAQVPANSVADLLKVAGCRSGAAGLARAAARRQHRPSSARRRCGRTRRVGNAGSNVVVGVIDTGVWPEHPMLSPTGVSAPAGGLKGCQFGNGTDPALGAAFACNNKLIGAYAFTATYMANVGSDGQEFCNNATNVCSPRDSEGHGTHTLTTAAGDCVQSAVLYGVERGPVCGIAPGAHVIMYRVCLAQGCFGSDSVAAVAAGDPRRRRRDQLLDLGRRQPVHRPGRAGVPRRGQRGHLRERVGRQRRPGRGHRRTTAARG